MRINEYCTKERDEMQNDYTKFRITKEKSEIQMEKRTKTSYNKSILREKLIVHKNADCNEAQLLIRSQQAIPGNVI